MLPKLQYLLKQIHRFVAFYKVTVFTLFSNLIKNICARLYVNRRAFLFIRKRKK